MGEENSFISEISMDDFGMGIEEEVVEKQEKNEDGSPKIEENKDIDAMLKRQAEEVSEETHQEIEENETNPEGTEDPEENEEEEQEETESETPSTELDDDTSSPSADVYKLFAKGLYEEGVISDFSEEDFVKKIEGGSTPTEAINELVKQTVNKSKEDWKKSLPEKVNQLIEAYEEGVPFDEILNIKSNQIRLESVKAEHLESDKALREYLIKQDLLSREFSEEEAQEEYDLYLSSGKDLEKSKRALQNLQSRLSKVEQQKIEEAQKNKDLQNETQKKFLKTLKSKIDDTDEIVTGVQLTKKEKDDIFNTLTKQEKLPDGKTTSSIMAHRQKNPTAFDTTLAYLFNIGAFKLDEEGNPNPDWSKIAKIKKTKAVSDFENSLKKDGYRPKGSKGSSSREVETLGDSFISHLNI
jgi:hypothetical protein